MSRRNALRLAASTAVFAAALSSNAVAQEGPPEPDAPLNAAPAERSVSLTTDPTRPLLGMGIVGAEVRLGKVTVHRGFSPRDTSVAAWIGAGQVRMADTGGIRPVWDSCGELFYCDRATALWVGAQALLYPVGSFEHGAQLGVEASYMGVWVRRSYDAAYATMVGRPVPDARYAASALLAGPVIGYKLVTKPGFTLNPQLGLDLALTDVVTLVPRLALNAGWSF